MTLGQAIEPATGMFSSALGTIASYAWILIPLILVITVAIGAYIWSKIKEKKKQWTHTLIVRRVLNETGLLSDPTIHKMRRFPLIKKAEVFELEKPLLGGYLFPEISEYSGENQYSIILDRNNRIYTDDGSYFSPDQKSTSVSARHAEIDIARSNLKAKFQDINKIGKRIEWATIAKYAMAAIAIIAVMVVTLYGLQKWGESKKYDAQQAEAEAEAMNNLASAMDTIKATVNTQQLELTYLVQRLYNTTNIQPIIRGVE